MTPEVFSTSGYFRKTTGVWNQSLPSPRRAAKGHRASTARLPVIPLKTRSLVWSSPTTKSLDPIVLTPIEWTSKKRSLPQVTCGFSSNCPVPEDWSSEASRNLPFRKGRQTITDKNSSNMEHVAKSLFVIK